MGGNRKLLFKFATKFDKIIIKSHTRAKIGFLPSMKFDIISSPQFTN